MISRELRKHLRPGLPSPPVVMVVVALFGLLSFADYRVDSDADASVPASSWLAKASVGPSTPILADPTLELLSLTSVMGLDLAVSDPAGPDQPEPVQLAALEKPAGDRGSAIVTNAVLYGPALPDDYELPTSLDSLGSDAEADAGVGGVYGPQLPVGFDSTPRGSELPQDFDPTAGCEAMAPVYGPELPPEMAAAGVDAVLSGDFELLDEGADDRGIEASADPAGTADDEQVAGSTEDGGPSLYELLAGEPEGLHTVTYTREVTHRFRRGETMTEVLAATGMSAREVDDWLLATRKVYNLNRIYAGQQISLEIEMPSRELRRLSLDLDNRTSLVAQRAVRADGGWGPVVAERTPIVYERRLRVAGSDIESSLYMAAVAHDIPDKIISDMAEILGWEIHFARDIRPGASFRVVYEELVRSGSSTTIPGRVLALEVSNRGHRYEGFRYQRPNDLYSGYYDRNGEALGRSFLRYPVAFSRISSHFSRARFHPVLKVRRPHYGVDFAAATGTPVKAIADGRVLKAGWYGGNGRFVKIRHDPVYESGYAHLSRIASGVHPGTTVKKGQVIGYVGSTGLATGPHLHFAMYKNGRYIDPLKADLPRARPLQGKSLAAFRMTVAMMDRAYARAGLSPVDSLQVADATAAAPDDSVGRD